MRPRSEHLREEQITFFPEVGMQRLRPLVHRDWRRSLSSFFIMLMVDTVNTPDVSPKSSKVGAFLPRPPPFRERISVFGHQNSRKGTNPIRLNDANPSFLPIRRSTFVYTALYSDAPSVQTCKKNHPSFVSKLGWLYGTSNGNRTHDFALRGQRLDRLTMEAYGWGTRIRT